MDKVSAPKKAPAPEKNRRRYESAAVVSDYVTREALFPAESTALAAVGPGLARMRMLDIGCGGGRTTLHLSQKVGDYLGIDYSPAMVAACRRRFPRLPASALRVGDVRNLSGLGAFDFILFSHNGLDYISHEDRLRALAEIRKVANPGALFLFSSHNLPALGAFARTDRVRGPRAFLKRALMITMVSAVNGGLRKLRRRDYAVIRDEGCAFGLSTYYVRPGEQLRQLAEAGFGEVRIIGADGRCIGPEADPDALTDKDLHYLARG